MAAEKAEIDALKKECDSLRTKIEVSIPWWPLSKFDDKKQDRQRA